MVQVNRMCGYLNHTIQELVRICRLGVIIAVNNLPAHCEHLVLSLITYLLLKYIQTDEKGTDQTKDNNAKKRENDPDIQCLDHGSGISRYPRPRAVSI